MPAIDRITINPLQCGGRPCVRGMRIRVSDVIDLLAAGLTADQVVEDLPDLELADVVACQSYLGIPDMLRGLVRDAADETFRFAFSDGGEIVGRVVSATHVDEDDTFIVFNAGGALKESGWQLHLDDIVRVKANDGCWLYERPESVATERA